VTGEMKELLFHRELDAHPARFHGEDLGPKEPGDGGHAAAIRDDLADMGEPPAVPRLHRVILARA
jgi:hypothetical protein